jgi:palmitoyltransferase
MASSKLVGIVFRFIFFTLVCLNYIFTVFYIWIPKTLEEPLKGFLFLIYYHILFFLIVWTVYATSKSDPGQVPLYWGFYIGDPDSKRTRYCLMCNVFKPLRCHHCSMCNRCVLNMDHHCPWINSCIGFYNRKFFIQMVFYLIVTIFSTLIANGYSVYDLIKNSIINKDFQLSWRFAWMALYIIIYIIDLIMGFILIQFFKFHIKLILENKTTIETLDHKGKEFQSKYDIGVWNNWYQVMGITKWLWFIPLKIYQGKPKGNGIDWVDNDEDLMPSSNRVENNNINDETGNDNYKNIELSAKLNDEKDMDKSRISSIKNDVTGISALSKNQHGSMSSLYQ